jgi:hypothetical protein
VERAVGNAGEVSVEDLWGVGGQRGERDHGGEHDVAEFGLHVVPGVGDALARVLAHNADDGLGDLAGFLGELHDAEQLLGLRRQDGAGVEPVHDVPDGAPGVIHDLKG